MKVPNGKKVSCVGSSCCLFLYQGVKIQPCRCQMMCPLLSWEGVIFILRLDAINHLPLLCTTKGFDGHIVKELSFPPQAQLWDGAPPSLDMCIHCQKDGSSLDTAEFSTCGYPWLEWLNRSLCMCLQPWFNFDTRNKAKITEYSVELCSRLSH